MKKTTGVISSADSNSNEIARKFAIAAHAGTNHLYDSYLPYEFHLRMVVRNAEKYLHLVDMRYPKHVLPIRSLVIDACWLHDTIEDTRCTYNDIIEATGSKLVAEIVLAVTNYARGRDRAARMPDFIYNEIRDTEGAIFVKLCDRLANIQYSEMTNSPKLEMYMKEHRKFMKELRVTDGPYEPMWDEMDRILIGNF